MKNLTSEVRQYAKTLGARLVGIATVERLSGAPRGHRAEDFLSGARSVLVLGLPVLPTYARYPEFLADSEKVPETVIRRGSNNSEEHFSPRLAIANHVYRRCGYEFLNMELQRLSLYTALFLQEKGHESIYMPTAYGATFTWDMSYPRPNSMGPFSARHAAVAAGLGQLGLNNLLLTPQYGPLQRIVAIITAAPLEPDPLLDRQLCLGEQCGRCRKECPKDCFSEDIETYTVAGTETRVFRMDKGRCGQSHSPLSKRCIRQCFLKCPLIKCGVAAKADNCGTH